MEENWTISLLNTFLLSSKRLLTTRKQFKWGHCDYICVVYPPDHHVVPHLFAMVLRCGKDSLSFSTVKQKWVFCTAV